MTLEEANNRLKKISKGMKCVPFISYAAVVENPREKNNYFIEFGVKEYKYQFINIKQLQKNQRTYNASKFFLNSNSEPISIEEKSDSEFIKSSIYNISIETIDFGLYSSGVELLSQKNTGVTDYKTAKPISGGITISNENMSDSVGTLGALVELYDGNFYAMTNAHVVSDADTELNERIYHLHKNQSGDSKFEIGQLKYWNYNKKMDVALIKINDKVLPYLSGGNISDATPIKGIKKVALGDKVKKYGSTTKLSWGNIRSLNASISVIRNFKGKKENIVMTNQVMVENMHADSGDSGSLVISEDNQAVGLLFARDEKAERAFFSPITKILTEEKTIGSNCPPFPFKKFYSKKTK